MNALYKLNKIGFIGAGNMTRSLSCGLALNSEFNTKQIYITNKTHEKSVELANTIGGQALQYTDELLDKADYVVLAMKPQDLPDFLESYGKSFTANHTVLSLCAGITLESLRKQLPQVKQIARLMPSTTCEVGQGVLGVYAENPGLASDLAEYFTSVGVVQVVETEEALNGIMIAVASGVGLVLEIMQIWAEWLEDLGFEKKQAEEITKKSFSGVADLVTKSNRSFVRLQSDVTSKKGVTQAALDAFRENELDSVLNKGFEAALRKNKELEQLV